MRLYIDSLLLAPHATVVSDQFWPVTAQVVPVLALAIVVEARATMQRWDENIPRWVRSFQGILWGATLVLFAVTEITAFSVLAGGAAAAYAVTLAQAAVAIGISVLVIAPASDFMVRSNAWAIARGIVQVSDASLRWKILRATFRNSHQRTRLRLSLKKRIPRILQRMEALEQQIRSGEHPECEDCQARLAELADLQRDISQEADRMTEADRILADQQSLLRDTGKDIRKKREAAVAVFEKSVTAGNYELKGAQLPSLELDESLRKRIGDMTARVDKLSEREGDTNSGSNP